MSPAEHPGQRLFDLALRAPRSDETFDRRPEVELVLRAQPAIHVAASFHRKGRIGGIAVLVAARNRASGPHPSATRPR
jgi:hypothetical protein